MSDFVARDFCFACGQIGRPAGAYRHVVDQSDFVPEPHYSGWSQRPHLLIRCIGCGSLWPAKIPSGALLSQWYATQTYASGGQLTAGHQAAAHWFERRAFETIVDVGCGAGGFLDTLPRRHGRFGLEPSRECIAVGVQRGRKILAPDDTGWHAELPAAVNAITLFDVVEHIEDPKPFLRSLAARLKPGGHLLIFTGDASSAWARLCGPSWWYLGWAGHISVFSEAGLRRVMADCELDVVTVQRKNALEPSRWFEHPRHAARLAMTTLGQRVRDIRNEEASIAASAAGDDHMLLIAQRRRQ